MPPLEAMQAGTPVVSSHALPMPEILGDAPLYFAPESPQELAAAVRRLLTEPITLGAQCSERGRRQAALYTLRAMAEKTVALWREAVV